MQTQLKIKFIVLATFFVLPVLLTGGAKISEFTARQQNNSIVIRWVSTSEYHVDSYEIERSINNSNWESRKIVQAKGSGTSNTKQVYSFVDKSIFKSNQSTFSYRLKIIDNDGSISYFNKTVDVASSVSGIRHTWGSIKASFR